MFGLPRVALPFRIGGYYFGSVDQERYDCHAFACFPLTRTGKYRYMIQRYARKMHGRVFGKMSSSNVHACLYVDKELPL
jgi:hypothetical protein